MISSRQFGDLEELKEHDVTPKAVNDNWRFTPSLMDPNSFAFANFANQPPGYYTPTPGGVNTLYHSQAGDLHTPGMGMNIGTPLSLSHPSSALHVQDPSMADFHNFPPQFLHSHPFQNLNPFSQPPTHQPQSAYHPSNFLQHQDSGYDAMDGTPDKSPANTAMMMRHTGNHIMAGISESTLVPPSYAMGEK